jgi:molybdate transport system permease protein
MQTEPLTLDARQAETRARAANRPESRFDAWQLMALPLFLLILLPILALFLRLSPAEFWATLQQEQAVQALRLSFSTSLTTVFITWLLGTPVAYLLYRRHSNVYRILDTLVDLPTILPPAVAGVALLMAFGRQGLVGVWLSPLGISIPFTTAAVVIAQTFIAAPLYIKSAALGFASVDCELKKAAALDGANRWEVFRYIMLPMTWMSLLSGSVLTWARALGEFGATIIFAGNFAGRTQTMPLAIYLGFEVDLRIALTLSALLICVSFVALALVKWVLHSHLDTGLEND